MYEGSLKNNGTPWQHSQKRVVSKGGKPPLIITVHLGIDRAHVFREADLVSCVRLSKHTPSLPHFTIIALFAGAASRQLQQKRP